MADPLDRAREAVAHVGGERSEYVDDAQAYAAVSQAESLQRIADALERIAAEVAPGGAEKIRRQLEGR